MDITDQGTSLSNSSSSSSKPPRTPRTAYENVQLPSTMSSNCSSLSSHSNSDDPEEQETTTAQASPPLASARSTLLSKSNATPPLPLERSASRDEDRSQQPSPKPRRKKMKEASSSTAFPSSHPVEAQPSTATKPAKQVPPGIIPRIKVANEPVSVSHQTQPPPSSADKEPVPLPGMSSSAAAPHCKRAAKTPAALPSPSPQIRGNNVSSTLGEDEFGYGILDFIGVDGEEEKIVSASPSRRKSELSSSPKGSTASVGSGSNSSIVDAVSDISSLSLFMSSLISISSLIYHK